MPTLCYSQEKPGCARGDFSPSVALACLETEVLPQRLSEMIALSDFAYRDFIANPDPLRQAYKFGRAHYWVFLFAARHPDRRIAIARSRLYRNSTRCSRLSFAAAAARKTVRSPPNLAWCNRESFAGYLLNCAPQTPANAICFLLALIIPREH
jgi:hypothetical protein